MFNFFIHTHTDCKDIWPAFFGRANKYFPQHQKNVLVNNADSFLNNYNTIIYEPDLDYTSRIKNGLKNFGDEVILFTHEDMILYNEPNHDIVNEFCDLIKNDKADFIKLLKCANVAGEYYFPPSDTHPNLTPCERQYSFTIQPTLCKASKLLDVFNSCSPANIWDFERKIDSIFNNFIHNKCFMSSFENEAKRGQAHWDSKSYPHGNMIFKGKWTYSEYSKEIDSLCEEYGIDYKKRGIA